MFEPFVSIVVFFYALLIHALLLLLSLVCWSHCAKSPLFSCFLSKDTYNDFMLFHDRKRAFKGTGSQSKTDPLMRLDDHIPFIHFTSPLPARNGFGTSASFIGPLNYFVLYPLVLSYVCYNCCCLLLVTYLVHILHLSCTSLS